MKIIAIWIIDENYILPAYISICSFLQSNKIPITVVFCGDNSAEEAKSLFVELGPLISFKEFNCPKEFENSRYKNVIANRLARMHYAKMSEDEVVLLLDADTIFTDRGNELIQKIESEYTANESAIFGVLDAQVAYRDFLYFNTKDQNGRDVVVPHLEQKDIYAQVFGDNWWHLLKGPSINNGVVAFYKCEQVVEVWEAYYRSGLQNEKVNSGDDQLPLAAAISKTSQHVFCLPELYNSKGKVKGDYIVFHALSSIWKRQIYAAYKGEDGVSTFSDLVKQFIPQIPPHILNDFIETQKTHEPYLFRQLDGKFGFQHLYEDVISGIDSGTVVEVGMKRGKSTCYMAELIKNTKKDIHFYTVNEDDFSHQESNSFFDLIRRFDLEEHVQFLSDPIDSSKCQLDNNIDFVFLNLENDYNNLTKNLNYWFERLKPGGILAGYDFTSQIGLDYGSNCATYNFCENRNLTLRISFDIFIIQKPTLSIKGEDINKTKFVLQESNVAI